MRKRNIIFIILFLALNINSYSQIYFGEEQIITESASGFVHIHSSDLDADGDEDIIACKYNTLLWYENDGLGNFIDSNIIVNGEGSMQSVYIVDLDGDDNMDILTESNQAYPNDNDQVVCFMNDGFGNFDSKIIITDQINTGHCVFAADLDGDGDNDVLSASVYDDKIAWYENIGNGNFGVQQIISSTTDGASTVYASDLDGDGDNDIIAGGAWDNTLSWYENLDGNGNFGEQNLISSSVNSIQFAYTADLDNDSDPDIYLAMSNKIVWYDNDGSGNFGAQHLIAHSPHPTDICAQDFDNDGDLDIVATDDESSLKWYINNSIGEFSEPIIISTANNRSVYSAELNGDNKYDIITASWYQKKVSWYENMGIASIEKNNNI